MRTCICLPLDDRGSLAADGEAIAAHCTRFGCRAWSIQERDDNSKKIYTERRKNKTVVRKIHNVQRNGGVCQAVDDKSPRMQA
jgi:hypothetical protein